MVGDEKKPEAPLICAALFQPVLEVNERKFDSLPIGEIVKPAIGVAELDSDASVKLKFARVAACADDKLMTTARLSLPSEGVFIRG